MAFWAQKYTSMASDGVQKLVEDHMDVAFGRVLEHVGTLFSNMFLLR